MRRNVVLFAFSIGTLVLGGSVAATDGAKPASGWPGLRGPTYDGAVREARLLGGGGPARLVIGWKRPLGPGYSSVVAGDGRLVTMFSSGGADVAAAFDPATGDEIWRYRVDDAYVGHDGSHDGPIATPLLSGGIVYGLGPRGLLFALDAASGRQLWARDIVKEHGAQQPFYGFACSPILIDNVLVVEIGAGPGKTVAGFHPDDGRLLWSAGDDTIAYQSPIAATIGGKLQAVAAGKKTILGLDAKSGAVLWSFAHASDDGGESTIPVPAGEGRFLLMNKSDSSTMIQVSRDPAGAWKVAPLWTANSIKGTYAMPVYHEGHLYGMTNRIFTCVDAATGETKWRSRETGDGFPILVGSHMVIMAKLGTLIVAEPSPQEYRELMRLDLFQEHAWSGVVWADGHLYTRSMAQLARVDLAAGAPEAVPMKTAASTFGRFLDEVKAAPDKGSVIDAFLAKQTSFPIVEDTGAVHFVYRGAASDVGIVGDMIGFTENSMTRVPGTDLFYYSTRLEPNAAITYGFIVDYAKATADPRNPRPGSGRFGDVSWLAMPAWEEPDYSEGAGAARPGRLETVDYVSTAQEGLKRTAQVYLPAGYEAGAGRRYPVVYVHDGKEALEKGDMKNVLDHLIGRRVEPVIAVFVIPDPNNARRDLNQIDLYVEMLVKDLVPLIDGRYSTIAEAAGRATVGAAAGANAALQGGLKRSDVFSRVGAQSVMMRRSSEFDPVVGQAEERPLVIYLEWGTYHLRAPNETLDMPKANRQLWERLRQNGYRPAGGEVPEGFGWKSWRAHTGDMLAALFPLRREQAR
ncbi:MAG: PQQ-binding-like beta-propeller repeat protein [Candidatus Polarisedimenticolia bacterium]